MRFIFSTFVVLAAAITTFADGPAFWPQWRGPSGQGYVTDDKVPLEWSASKNLAWKTKLPGGGHSTPIIWGNRIFVTCSNPDGSERWIVCLDTKDGKILWQELAAKGYSEITHKTSNHATASCTTDGKHVYAFFGTPGLFCYTVEGKKVWHHKFGVLTSETGWGFGASPVLFENLVIQNCDNDGPKFLPAGRSEKDAAPAALVALNKETGDVVWQTPRDQGRGFSTPVLIKTPSGRTDLVLNGPLGVWGYDPKDGKELWHCFRHPEDDRCKFGEPMPLFSSDRMFAAAGRELGALQSIKMDGQGDITEKGLAWEVKRKGIRDVGSGILAGKHLIFADWKSTISIHDSTTGNQTDSVRIKGPDGFYASPILLNGYVICVHHGGITYVLRPGPKVAIVRENLLSDGTHFSASPAVADGKLFLRSQTHLYCIGAKD